jgi:chromosome segregation ATPase
LELKNQSLGKLEQKIEENTKKYTQQIYGLEMEAKKYKEELQSLKEEMQYLEK